MSQSHQSQSQSLLSQQLCGSQQQQPQPQHEVDNKKNQYTSAKNADGSSSSSQLPS
eukprot:CAMPEP_0170802664 /NCGR_PEP_ID=MMETSP0733-20121128/29444_1 /TAXON_ID=186038 /ORGANISM="Fragilariopsis kerguelensis, Strain L26-C5" /LENGTH=55 /DNA_ID=CAMNT_0011155967 /DNA_START=1 /DNA_END=165 /DNA_ORIENTATION=-